MSRLRDDAARLASIRTRFLRIDYPRAVHFVSRLERLGTRRGVVGILRVAEMLRTLLDSVRQAKRNRPARLANLRVRLILDANRDFARVMRQLDRVERLGKRARCSGLVDAVVALRGEVITACVREQARVAGSQVECGC